MKVSNVILYNITSELFIKFIICIFKSLHYYYPAAHSPTHSLLSPFPYTSFGWCHLYVSSFLHAGM